MKLLNNIQGDKAIWAVVALLALFSFLPVYSASTNQVYVFGNHTTTYHLIKHGTLLLIGFGIIYGVHKVPTHFFKGLSMIAIPLVIVLLGYTLVLGKEVHGAHRWIEVPLIGSFQTSSLASVVLMVWVARYLAKIKDVSISFKESILPLWMPVAFVVLLILPANLSTAAMVAFMVMVLCFLGGYPTKYLMSMIGLGLVALLFTVMFLKLNPSLMPTRAKTWESRIDSYFDSSKVVKDNNRQSEYAMIAVASGGLIGKGSGKSIMKNVLSQSESDFIFAIIIEEYGMLGGLALIFFYMLLLFRIVVVANSTRTVFSKLVVVGVGLPIVFQALINMGVAVNLLPVTGQPLPLISMGGTSIWMTCVAIGVVLSASIKRTDSELESQNDIDDNNPLAVLSGQL